MAASSFSPYAHACWRHSGPYIQNHVATPPPSFERGRAAGRADDCRGRNGFQESHKTAATIVGSFAMYSSLFNRTAAAGSTARPTASLFHHSLNPLTVGHHPPPGFESATDCKCGRKVPSVQPILFISVAMIMVLGVALRTLHQKAGDIRELSRYSFMAVPCSTNMAEHQPKCQ